MADLKAAILTVLQGKKMGVQFGSIVREVQAQTEAAPSAIRQSLKELESENKVISYPESQQKVGRPNNLYMLVLPEAISKRAVTRDEQEEKQEKTLTWTLIEESAGKFTHLPPQLLQKVCYEAAKRFLEEDPVELLFDLGKWMYEQHAEYAVRLKKAVDAGTRAEEERCRHIVTELGEAATTLFNYTLGVPQKLRDKNGDIIAPKRDNGKLSRPAPYSLWLTERTMENNSSWSPSEFRWYLKQSVLGESVIEGTEPEKPKPPIHLGGSDASRQPIDLSTVLPWQIDPQEINIVTAVGVRYDIFTGAKDLDRQPEPRNLARYERRQAIEEGLLIPPPGTSDVSRDLQEKVLEASMDLRQYHKDYDLLFLKDPSVQVNFRDGRVFPLEHRLYDAIQRGHHGLIVRSALKVFRSIVNGVGSENGSMMYAGYVKRTHTPLIRDLFLWYVGFGSAKGGGKPILEMTIDDFVRAPESDSTIMSYLFKALRKVDEDATYVTFRVLRRFQSMEEDYIKSFPPSPDKNVWLSRLEKMIEDQYNTGPGDEGADLIASLCSRAAVLEFYVSFPKQFDPTFEPILAVPRMEFLVPYHDFTWGKDGPGPITEKEAEYVKRLLGAMFYPGVLEEYHEELNPMGRSPKVFLAPRTVTEAHESCKSIATIYRDDFLELLVQEAKIYWQQIKSGSALSVRGIAGEV